MIYCSKCRKTEMKVSGNACTIVINCNKCGELLFYDTSNSPYSLLLETEPEDQVFYTCGQTFIVKPEKQAICLDKK